MKVDRWKSMVARGRASVHAWERAVWNRDQAAMRGFAAGANRFLRIAILTVRGIINHRLELQAAALTYYTVFSIIPVLVVVLWILKAIDRFPMISPVVPDGANLPAGNTLLHSSIGGILRAVKSTSEFTSGIAGLGALLYAVTRLFRNTELALDTIASSGQRAPRLSRLLGYVALLVLPPAALVISGLLVAVSHHALGGEISRILDAVPGFKLGAGAAFAIATLWLGLTLFYASAARARIGWFSASVGAAVAAFALPAVLWAFAEFQIGVSHQGTVQSGLAAGPVFLLWVFSSWWVVLISAEIAVAHGVERIVIHGLRAFHLDAVGEQQTAAAIMVRAARAAAIGKPNLPVDELARALLLPPQLIRKLCRRLAARGLLVQSEEGFSLLCDPDRTGLPAVIDAVARDPALEHARAEALDQLGPRARAAVSSSLDESEGTDDGPTLQELAREAPGP